MSQILKPDRPIWPPVPETITPPGPEASEPVAADAPTSDAGPKPEERPAPVSGRIVGFEGFGSFAG